MAEVDRVCPRCGCPADHNAYCSECGFDLRSQGELPTRRQWVQERQQPLGEAIPPGAAPQPPSEPPISPAPPTKAGRPSFLRPVPLLVLAGVLIVAVVAVIIIISSGGGGGISRETVENRLEALLVAPPYGVSSPKMECPSDIEIETGKRVECHASAADGTTATVESEVRSTSGEGEDRDRHLGSDRGMTVSRALRIATDATPTAEPYFRS